MSGRAAFGGFLAAALALHLAAFAALPPGGGADTPATEGNPPPGPILAGADAALAALVEAWERTPAPATDAPTAAPPPTATAPPPDAIAAIAPPALSAPTPAPPSAAPPGLPAPPDPTAPAAADPPPPRPAQQAAKGPPQPSAAPARAATAPAPVAAGGSAATEPRPSAARDGGSAPANAMSAWQAAIHARLWRGLGSLARRPEAAALTVRLSIGADGRIRGVTLARPSASPAYDAEVQAAILRLGRVPAAPRGIPDTVHEFLLPVRVGG